MINIKCSIIQDILPIYIDEVVCSDTKELVETHLRECSSCSNIVNNMRKSVVFPSNPEIGMNDAKAIQNMKKKIKKKEIACVMAVLLPLCMVFFIFAGYILLHPLSVPVDGHNYISARNDENICETMELFIEDDEQPYVTAYTDTLPSKNPDDYLKLEFKYELRNRSVLPIDYSFEKIYWKEGRYKDRWILMESYDNIIEMETLKGTIVGTWADLYVYIGGLNEAEIDELMRDICLQFHWEDSWIHSEMWEIDYGEYRQM